MLKFLLPAFCIVLIQIVYLVRPQSDLRVDSLSPFTTNPCTAQSECGKCIEAGSECAFCTDAQYDETNDRRCNLLSAHEQRKCKNIVYPSGQLNRSKDDRVIDGAPGVNAIQIQPQTIDLKLRPKVPHYFTLTFRLAENYPVDLYYLMDLSNSMEDDKKKLASLGVKIAEEMGGITSNFKLGFGSFVDKVVMPYVSTAPNKINRPCPNCVPAYGFKNQLKLNENAESFRDKVNEVKVSGNLDAPEGGLDAIMQAVSCDIGWRNASRRMLLFSTDAGFHIAGDGQMQIGWRNQSRRMLLFSTDAGFHYAGDGKLGGIVTPNDGLCHLDTEGTYTESSVQDYPSISQIAAKVKEKNVNVIFAVTEKQVDVYSQLENFIAGSETGELASDSQNVVQLVRDNYLKITSKVELVVENADNLMVKFRTKCKGTEEMDTNTCKDLKIGDTVTFNVSIEATSCPDDISKAKQTFTIKPVGLPDSLTINMELMCDCECEKAEVAVLNRNHPSCNNQGTFVCGMCKCDDRYYGKTCSCDKKNSTEAEVEAKCVQENSTLVCSGRGQCVCGSCECDSRQSNSAQKYSGTWCECDNYNCPYFNKTICGGIEHGTCKCGKCICEPTYEGYNCGCNTDNSTCKANGGKGEICNGKGVCECGVCKCNATTGFYGPTCEDCPSCQGVCRQHKSCVQCVVHGTGDYDDAECKRECRDKKYITEKDVLEGGTKECEFKDEDDCIFFFTYYYDKDNNLKIDAQRTKECPPQVNVLAIVLGVIGGIVAVGLALLLVWKLVTTISDKRELARFEKETQNAKWDTGENPIFQPATSTFQNPTYNKK